MINMDMYGMLVPQNILDVHQKIMKCLNVLVFQKNYQSLKYTTLIYYTVQNVIYVKKI